MIVVQLPPSTLELPWFANLGISGSFHNRTVMELGIEHRLRLEVRRWLVQHGHDGEITLLQDAHTNTELEPEEIPCVSFTEAQRDIAVLFKLTWSGQ